MVLISAYESRNPGSVAYQNGLRVCQSVRVWNAFAATMSVASEYGAPTNDRAVGNPR